MKIFKEQFHRNEARLLLFFFSFKLLDCSIYYFPTVTLNRDLLAVCTWGSTETAAALWLLRDTPRQSTRSIFLEETTVFSSALWITGTPSFPRIPSNARTQCLPLYTTVPALVLFALQVSLLGQCQPWQMGSLLSTRCFPEQETSLPFLSVFLLALYRTSSTYRKRVQIPRLYVTQLPIFKTVKNRPHYKKWEVSSSYSLIIIWKTKQLIPRVIYTHMPFREQVFSKVELDAL